MRHSEQRTHAMVRLGIIALVVSTLAAACGGDAGRTEFGDTNLARHIEARTHGAAHAPGPIESLLDILPTTTFRDFETGEGIRYSDLFVVGTITDAQVGRYFANRDPDFYATDSHEVTSDDPDVAWATVHFTLVPEIVVPPPGGSTGSTEQIQVGIAVSAGTDVGVFVDELGSLGRVAVFLLEGSPVFEYDREIRAVVRDGMLLASVDEDGGMSFPVDPQESDGLITAAGYKVEDLLTASSNPVTIDVVWVGPVAVRADDTEGLAARDVNLEELVPATDGN